jgi:NADPH:quinone reductase-like Zn-dependent oxidoreductase
MPIGNQRHRLAQLESGALVDYTERPFEQAVTAGRLRPEIAAVLPLAQARRAHELGETGHARGKIVLQVI